MHTESPVRSREIPEPVGGDALAEGLMLVRASNLKMIRLQLAMERQDRRVALEAVDDLVALDRRLQDYLADQPGGGDQLLFRKALDAERAIVDREKWTLAAGVIRRQPEPLTEEAAPAEDDWLGPRELLEEDVEPRRKRGWVSLLLAAGVALGLGAGAYAIGPDNAQAWVMQTVGSFR